MVKYNIDFNTNRYIEIIINNNDLTLTFLPLTEYAYQTRIVHLVIHHPEFDDWNLSGNILPNYSGPHFIEFGSTSEGSAEIWANDGNINSIEISRGISKKLIFLWDGFKFILGLNSKNLVLLNN